MILGTHNTMSYRMPKKWYHYPILWTARCQSVDYKQQHEKYGANHFDFRLFWDKNGEMEFRHGIISYDASDFDEILKYCEDNGIICRVLFEERAYAKGDIKRSKEMNLRGKFVEVCRHIEEAYPNIKCYGGQNCGNFSEKLYKFQYNFKDVGYYASVTSLVDLNSKWVVKLSKKLTWLPNLLTKIDDLCPFLYARLKNRKTKSENVFDGKDDVLMHIDFINIG